MNSTDSTRGLGVKCIHGKSKPGKIDLYLRLNRLVSNVKICDVIQRTLGGWGELGRIGPLEYVKFAPEMNMG